AKALAPAPPDSADTELTGQFGTKAYMAPEQLLRERRAPHDPRSEVFAFGLVLYQMLTGKYAFDAAQGDELLGAILTHEPKPLLSHVPRWLAVIVERCLQKNPAKRFKSMQHVLSALKKS